MDRTTKIPCRSFGGKAPIKKLTVKEVRKFVPVTEGVKEPLRYKPGIVALLEILNIFANGPLTEESFFYLGLQVHQPNINTPSNSEFTFLVSTIITDPYFNFPKCTSKFKLVNIYHLSTTLNILIN
ncbi:hypothetical protein RND71_008527 [Anisodus tanguticus]|uniref:Uncharacterized protein n=1 Tax=Anisodus tanguticus TaxID=243964 RepID=A0AAE1SP90_9SOLA|nr:hypothetical protein RND71_008527 [Anisodus tanguticus]